MKIIQTVELNQLASIVKCVTKSHAFFFDNNKIILVSLTLFDQMNLFFQKIFCCRSASHLKLKNFTKISNYELKTILQHLKLHPVNPAVKEPPKPTIETAQEYFKDRNFGSAIKVLEKLDQSSEAVQQLYAEISKEWIPMEKIFCCRSASKLKLKNFTKISNPELKTILQSTPQQPPIQVTKKDEPKRSLNQQNESQQLVENILPMKELPKPTLETALEHFNARNPGSALKVLESLDPSSQPRIQDQQLQEEVIESLATKNYTFKTTVLDFTNL